MSQIRWQCRVLITLVHPCRPYLRWKDTNTFIFATYGQQP